MLGGLGGAMIGSGLTSSVQTQEAEWITCVKFRFSFSAPHVQELFVVTLCRVMLASKLERSIAYKRVLALKNTLEAMLKICRLEHHHVQETDTLSIDSHTEGSANGEAIFTKLQQQRTLQTF